MTQDESQTPTQVVAERVKEFREARGWSAQKLARRCADAGMPHLGRSVLANLESGRRGIVTIDEVLTLAWVLGVPPILMFLPVGTEDRVQITPHVAVHPDLARKWVIGEEFAPTETIPPRIAAHVDTALSRRVSVPLALYAKLNTATEAIDQAERELRWAAGDELVAVATSRRDEALRAYAAVLDDMTDLGVRPPTIWRPRYEQVRPLLKRPDEIQPFDVEEEDD